MPRRIDMLSVEEVQARFEAWRQKRQGRTAIPDELWSAASQLARRHGVNRTAAALRLDGKAETAHGRGGYEHREKGYAASVCRTDRTTYHRSDGVHDRTGRP